MMWYGMTEYGVEENVPNHDAVSVVISVPTSESTSAFKMYVTALPAPLPRVDHAFSYAPSVPVAAWRPIANSAGRPT